MRDPGRNVPLQAVNGHCLGCGYRMSWIVIRGRQSSHARRETGDAGAAKQSGVKGFGEIAKVERDSMSRDRVHLITLSALISTFCGGESVNGLGNIPFFLQFFGKHGTNFCLEGAVHLHFIRYDDDCKVNSLCSANILNLV